MSDFYINSVKVSEEEFPKIMESLQDSYERELVEVAQALGIDEEDAASIIYLRSRSRWTQEKEDFLIELSKTGEKLPNVFSGDF